VRFSNRLVVTSGATHLLFAGTTRALLDMLASGLPVDPMLAADFCQIVLACLHAARTIDLSYHAAIVRDVLQRQESLLQLARVCTDMTSAGLLFDLLHGASHNAPKLRASVVQQCALGAARGGVLRPDIYQNITDCFLPFKTRVSIGQASVLYRYAMTPFRNPVIHS